MEILTDDSIAKLKLKEEQLHKVIAASADAIISTNSERIIIQWNKAASTIFGYSEHEAMGNKVDMIIPKEFLLPHIQGVNNFLKTGKGKIMGKTVELKGKHKDGHIIPIELSLSAIKWEDSYIFTGIMRDVTEISKAKEIIQNQLEELKALDKQKEEFSTMVAHELRTPLTPIAGYLEMLLNEDITGKRSTEEIEMLQEIQKCSNRLSDLVEEIFLAQRLELDQVKIHNDYFQVNDFMVDVLKSNSISMKEKKIDFVDSTPRDYTIYGDSEKIKQIFSNLIYNAIDFVPEYGRIEINAQDAVGTYSFFVRDNGKGISKDQYDKLFNKFYQVDSSMRRTHEGTGLGLVICRGLVEGMGGKIWVESEEGYGSTFYFSIPKEKNEDTDN